LVRTTDYTIPGYTVIKAYRPPASKKEVHAVVRRKGAAMGQEEIIVVESHRPEEVGIKRGGFMFKGEADIKAGIKARAVKRRIQKEQKVPVRYLAKPEVAQTREVTRTEPVSGLVGGFTSERPKPIGQSTFNIQPAGQTSRIVPMSKNVIVSERKELTKLQKARNFLREKKEVVKESDMFQKTFYPGKAKVELEVIKRQEEAQKAEIGRREYKERVALKKYQREAQEYETAAEKFVSGELTPTQLEKEGFRVTESGDMLTLTSPELTAAEKDYVRKAETTSYYKWTAPTYEKEKESLRLSPLSLAEKKVRGPVEKTKLFSRTKEVEGQLGLAKFEYWRAKAKAEELRTPAITTGGLEGIRLKAKQTYQTHKSRYYGAQVATLSWEKGFKEEFRERPIKQAALTGVGFIGGGVYGKVSKPVSKFVAGSSIAGKIGTGVKVAVPTGIVGVTTYQVSKLPTLEEKGKFVGKLSAESLALGIGFGAGTKLIRPSTVASVVTEAPSKLRLTGRQYYKKDQFTRKFAKTAEVKFDKQTFTGKGKKDIQIRVKSSRPSAFVGKRTGKNWRETLFQTPSSYTYSTTARKFGKTKYYIRSYTTPKGVTVAKVYKGDKLIKTTKSFDKDYVGVTEMVKTKGVIKKGKSEFPRFRKGKMISPAVSKYKVKRFTFKQEVFSKVKPSKKKGIYDVKGKIMTRERVQRVDLAEPLEIKRFIGAKSDKGKKFYEFTTVTKKAQLVRKPVTPKDYFKIQDLAFSDRGIGIKGKKVQTPRLKTQVEQMYRTDVDITYQYPTKKSLFKSKKGETLLGVKRLQQVQTPELSLKDSKFKAQVGSFIKPPTTFKPQTGFKTLVSPQMKKGYIVEPMSKELEKVKTLPRVATQKRQKGKEESLINVKDIQRTRVQDLTKLGVRVATTQVQKPKQAQIQKQAFAQVQTQPQQPVQPRRSRTYTPRINKITTPPPPVIIPYIGIDTPIKKSVIKKKVKKKAKFGYTVSLSEQFKPFRKFKPIAKIPEQQRFTGFEIRPLLKTQSRRRRL
jgi:hypothetical protein